MTSHSIVQSSRRPQQSSSSYTAMSSRNPPPSLSTLSIHADDPLNNATDVAPPLHVSTTFRYGSDPSLLDPANSLALPSAPGAPVTGPNAYVYSRCTAPNTSRLELLLSEVIGAPSLVYSSGLAAFHALLTWTHPKVVAIGAGYHGCHGVLKVYQKISGCRIVDLFDEKSWDAAGLGKGDVVHLETPVNPNGLAYNIQAFADAAHKRGAILTVDATFAPPPLLDPFRFGADFVMHSGTKYFGGHSDMLCGVLAVKQEKDFWGLFEERVFLGSVMGSLEGWLGVRSLRTLELRVMRQSESATKLVQFLEEKRREGGNNISDTVAKVEHASLQHDDMVWLKEQMPNGFGPVFSIWMKSPELAKRLPSKLAFFHHATSLGGVESLIEWRRMSDATVGEELLRVSVGVESWDDLRDDLEGAVKALVSEGVV